MALFALAMLVIVLVGGVLIGLAFSSPADHKAIETSGVVALVVQLFSFAVIRLTSAQSVFSGWIVGVVLRFVTLFAYAFVAVKLLGLPAPAALLSLCTFFFISILVEPKLLTL